MSSAPRGPRRALAFGLAALLTASGAIHLVRPGTFDPIVPRSLPGPARAYTLVSGVAELAVAVALFDHRTRRLGGALAAALFAAVFPANVTMALRALHSTHPSRRRTVLTIARLPLQVPLVIAGIAVAYARRSPEN